MHTAAGRLTLYKPHIAALVIQPWNFAVNDDIMNTRAYNLLEGACRICWQVSFFVSLREIFPVTAGVGMSGGYRVIAPPSSCQNMGGSFSFCASVVLHPHRLLKIRVRFSAVSASVLNGSRIKKCPGGCQDFTQV